MKKLFVLLLLIIVVSAACFIPFTQQKTTLLKLSFLNVYKQLSHPDNWKKWRRDLQNAQITDSSKVAAGGGNGSFTMTGAKKVINVNYVGTTFNIRESGNLAYSYFLVPDTIPSLTRITVSETTTAFNYLIDKSRSTPLSATHFSDLVHFLNTDSLYYGAAIFKTKVPESNLIVIRKEVLAKDKFNEASKMFTSLKSYIQLNGIKQMQPVIAQYIPKGKDSTQVNVGFFVDKAIVSTNAVNYMRMPKGGPLYSARFNGEFNRREKVYSALNQYFKDHVFQTAILPFETYLDNKLPKSDTDRINIQVNFTTY